MGVLGTIKATLEGVAESKQAIEAMQIEALYGASPTTVLGLASYMTKDFIGINMNNLSTLQTDITKLISDVNADLEAFGDAGDAWDQGLKGKAQETAKMYVETIKGLLNAYVSNFNDIIGLANSAAHQIYDADVANKQVIDSAGTDVQGLSRNVEKEAQSIDVDGLY